MKWLKIKALLGEILGRPVDILMSTELDDNIRSAVEFNQSHVVLYMNARFCKDVESVIENVAHEITHVLLWSNVHDNEFSQKLACIHEDLKERMKDI